MTITQLREAYSAAAAELHDAADAFQGAGADTSEEDLAALEARFDAAETAADAARAALDAQERVEAARDRTPIPVVPDNDSAPEARVVNEPLTYQAGNGRSIFRDMFRAEYSHDRDAAARLQSHIEEMRVERPGNRTSYDLSSTDAAGGYLVAPAYLQDEFVALARASRVYVNAIGVRPLPPNTDSINIPTMATGTAVAAQADNAAVQETDATFGTVAADVKTIAGMQDVSQQLVDRGVPGIDGIIFADLARAYNVSFDVAALNSSTANFQGALQVAGTNAVTYTDASPTVAELYPKVADAIQRIDTGVFTPASAIFVHPRRWGWLLAAADTAGRPLVTEYGAQNAVAASNVVSEGLVGALQGVPVYKDANIPTNLGGGTNEDAVIVVHAPDILLWEDQAGPYLETFRDVGSGTLTVRFRLHNYVAQAHGRRPAAISKINGTGLIAPTF